MPCRGPPHSSYCGRIRPTIQCHHMTVRIDGSVEKSKRVNAHGQFGAVSNQGRISTVSEARVDITTDPQNNRPHRRGCGWVQWHRQTSPGYLRRRPKFAVRRLHYCTGRKVCERSRSSGHGCWDRRRACRIYQTTLPCSAARGGSPFGAPPRRGRLALVR